MIEIIKALEGCAGKDSWKDKRMATAEETNGFVHIKDLKAGDKVKINRPTTYKRPHVGEVVTVYDVIDPVVDFSGKIAREDFTALVVDADGEIAEFAFDSRFFERVKD